MLGQLFDVGVQVFLLISGYLNTLATKAEGLTYYIYITHHVFLHGVLCVDQISSSIPLQLICFLFFTYISAKILKYIEQRILFVFA